MTNNLTQNTTSTGLMQAEQSRAIQEVQAALVIGKQFPRDMGRAIENIKRACKEPALAEMAIYTYKRGDTMVSGPSIRMAEMLAQSWGNLNFGIRELEQANGESVAQAYCWDTETNVRQEKTFTVPHKRHTKRGSYDLKDPRDIYELVANSGARRLRACILGVIPGYIQDIALKEVEGTLAGGSDEPLEERITKMLDVFKNEYGVTKAMIEGMLQHNAESITDTELVKLKGIYRSLRDGIVKIDYYFEELREKPTSETTSDLNEKLAAKVGKPAKAVKPEKPVSQPEQEEPPLPEPPPEMQIDEPKREPDKFAGYTVNNADDYKDLLKKCNTLAELNRVADYLTIIPDSELPRAKKFHGERLTIVKTKEKLKG